MERKPITSTNPGVSDDSLQAAVPNGCPTVNHPDRAQAAANLRRYVEIALAVVEASEQSKLTLTGSERIPTIKEKVER